MPTVAVISGLDDVSVIKFDARQIRDPIARHHVEVRAYRLTHAMTAALGDGYSLSPESRCAIERAAQLQSLISYGRMRLKFLPAAKAAVHAKTMSRLETLAMEAARKLSIPTFEENSCNEANDSEEEARRGSRRA